MTAFVNDEGEYLDYSGTDIGTTKQCANFYEFKIKGDVSATLKIPNNSVNRKALGFYGAQQVDSPAFSRTPFNMVKDGNIISRGYIVVKEAAEDSLSVFYISGNTNWFQSFQFNLKDIDFPDKFTVLSNDIDGRKAATEGLIFPIIDWWASSSKRSTSYIKTNRAPSPEDFPVITELHPCIYLHTLVDQMGRYGGINIEGDLTEDSTFKKIIITPSGPEYYVPDTVIQRSYARIQNGPFGSAGAGVYDYTLDPQLVRLNTLIEGIGQVEASTYSFFAPYTATYRVDIDFWVNNVDTYSVEAWVDGSLYTVMFNESLSTRNKVGTKFINMRRGQRLQFYVNNTAAANYRLDYLTNNKYTNVSIKIEKLARISPAANLSGTSTESASYVIPNAIVPDMKAIDLIKFMANYFSCVVSFDEYANTISINKLASFKKEDAEDWSEFYVSHREKWDTKIAANNYIQMGEGSESDISAYNEQNQVTYGGGNIQTPFDSKDFQELYIVPFSPSWDVRNKSYSKVFLPYINFYDLDVAETVTYSGVSSSGGLAKFTATFNDPIAESDIFYIISSTGIYSGYSTIVSSATPTTDPTMMIDYVAGDSGTLVKYTASKVDGNPRMLLCEAGRNLSEIGVSSVSTYLNATLVSTITTGPICWFDKSLQILPIDSYNESLSIDPINEASIGISERYYGPIKKIFSNPLVEAYFTLPLSVFQRFEFDRYIYIKTKNLTGYFIVQRIENYRDALTPVKCDLLYAD